MLRGNHMQSNDRRQVINIERKKSRKCTHILMTNIAYQVGSYQVGIWQPKR